MSRTTDDATDDATEAKYRRREPTDGESVDKNGRIRPVPPGVPNTPDTE